MTHRFRLRWRLEHGRTFDDLSDPISVGLLPGGAECELKAVGDESRSGGQGLALKSGPFHSADEALAAGERVLAGLLLASLRRGFGLSLNARIPAAVVTSYGKRVLAGDRFDTVYDDSYGLVVFEDVGRTGFVSAGEMALRMTGPATAFVNFWSTAVAEARPLSDRMLISYDLWASSRFENSSRARYLLLIMAVEALVEQPTRSNRELKLLDSLLKAVATAGLDHEQSAALSSGIGMLKKVSIGHSCKVFLDRLIGTTVVTDLNASAHFTQCYKMRGRIVHGGAIPPAVDLGAAANRLEQTVREVLTATIEGRTEHNEGPF